MKDEISTQVPKQALRKTDVSGSYIRIEIVDYFGAKKVIEVKPYFDKQQLTEIEFLNAIRLLEEEKNKATMVLCVRFCVQALSSCTGLSAKLTYSTCYNPFLFIRQK